MYSFHPMTIFRVLLMLTIMYGSMLSCQETKDEFQLEEGRDYFPLKLGKVMIYQVDSVIFDPAQNGTSRDSSTSFFREEVVDVFLSNSGDSLWIWERTTKKNLSDPWRFSKRFTAETSENGAFVTEDNLRFFKLAFPLALRKQWDGTAFIDPFLEIFVADESIEMFKGWSSQVTEINMPGTIGTFSFDQVASIEHANEENAIELRFAREQYAKNIGLAYRELKILDTQCIEDCLGQPWEEKAEKGFLLKQTLLEYQ